MRLLLVVDDQNLGTSLQEALRPEGHAVNLVDNATAASAALQGEPYDLLIIDLALSDSTAIPLIHFLRKSPQRTVLVLVLGDRVNKNARIDALDAGADDCLLKPFGVDELRANIRALVRRQAGRPVSELVHGALRLDPASRSVTVHNAPVALTPREFAVLEVLLENSGRVVSKSRLEEALYAWDEEVESNVVEVHIHRLRKKLGAKFIRTVRGVGYAMTRKSAQPATGTGDEKQLTVVEPIETPTTEHKPLLGALDELFKRLAHDINQERDICIETTQNLREPLEAAKLQAEIALQTDDPKTREQLLEDILRATDQAQALVGSLATVIELDRDNAPTITHEVDLCEICANVIADIKPVAEERHIALSLVAPCAGMMLGDENLLKVLVRQLLESIIAKTPIDHAVEIGVHLHDEMLILTLHRSSGEDKVGTPAEAKRITLQRSLQHPAQSQKRWSGWWNGLSLVERIIELHSGKLAIANESSERLYIELHFPVNQENIHVRPKLISSKEQIVPFK